MSKLIYVQLPCLAHLLGDKLIRQELDQLASLNHQALHCIPAVEKSSHVRHLKGIINSKTTQDFKEVKTSLSGL